MLVKKGKSTDRTIFKHAQPKSQQEALLNPGISYPLPRKVFVGGAHRPLI